MNEVREFAKELAALAAEDKKLDVLMAETQAMYDRNMKNIDRARKSIHDARAIVKQQWAEHTAHVDEQKAFFSEPLRTGESTVQRMRRAYELQRDAQLRHGTEKNEAKLLSDIVEGMKPGGYIAGVFDFNGNKLRDKP